jgi:hypothetical protein
MTYESLKLLPQSCTVQYDVTQFPSRLTFLAPVQVNSIPAGTTPPVFEI